MEIGGYIEPWKSRFGTLTRGLRLWLPRVTPSCVRRIKVVWKKDGAHMFLFTIAAYA